MSEYLTLVRRVSLMLWAYIVIGIISVGAVMVLRKAQADPRNRVRR